MAKDKESLLNEANLLSPRISKNNDIEDLATNDEDITQKDLDYIASQSDHSDESYQYESEDQNIRVLENEDYQETDIESSKNSYEDNEEDNFQETDEETLDIEVIESFEEYENDFEDKYLEELPEELNEQEFNWDNFDDFEELDGIYEKPEKITKDGKLTREQRANQVAVEILKKYDWDEKHLPLLKETFKINRYPASRVAIERQLNIGMLPEELELALFIRELWASNGHYWLSFFSIYNNQTQKENSNIGWKYPLQIIRSFTYLPSQEEIQYFLETIYDDWYCSEKLRKIFKAFIIYIEYRTGSIRGTLSGNEQYSFTKYYDEDSFIDNEIYHIINDSRVLLLKNECVDLQQMIINKEQKYCVVKPEGIYGDEAVYNDG